MNPGIRSLRSAWANLPRPDPDRGVGAAALTGTNAWVFKKPSGALGFLLTGVTPAVGLPELQHLKVSYKAEKILDQGGRQFTLRRCLEVEADPECDPETFGRILERLQDDSPTGHYTTQLVVQTIRDTMAIVQRAPGDVSFEEALGAWGELETLRTLLHRATSPTVQRRIIGAWESEGRARDIIDFRFPWAGMALEVKTSTGKRIHHFHGHGQITVPPDYDHGYVVSVQADREVRGLTCSELVAEIRTLAIGAVDERLAFGEELDRKLSVRGRACHDEAYRFTSSEQTFTLIPMENVPRPSVEPNITAVEWTADVSNCTWLREAEAEVVVSTIVN